MTLQQLSGEMAEIEQFFAPTSSDMIDGLIGQYRAERAKIEQVDQFLSGDGFSSVVHYFIEGNREELHGLRYVPATDKMFQVEPAIAALNASYWDRALKMTDVLDCMPQKRRDEWWEQIKEHKAPEFEEESVRATLTALLSMRGKFFAERVDGMFRALSREHVTNRPEGFYKRMIISGALTSYGTIDTSTAGHINDLRCVIARFMGRAEPAWHMTNAVIGAGRRNPGQWMDVDGAALRIRVYAGVGTAHLEVHPEMAWRLNAILASLYPTAIPSKFRDKPKRARKIKDFVLFDRPLPFSVVGMLAGMKEATERVDNGFNRGLRRISNTRQFEHGDRDKATTAEAERVLTAIGGVKQDGYWKFDYEPQPVLDEIICSGRIPDHKSHQFYPTPAILAEKAIELAEITAESDCLEPSAGTGNLADMMTGGRSLCCIEISTLHCRVLEAKGLKPITKDFLQWDAPSGFDRIVMNPPFSEGRWLAHIEHAAVMLRRGGRLVAILPSSAKGKSVLDESRFDITWSEVFKNQFPGASVDVVIMLAEVRV